MLAFFADHFVRFFFFGPGEPVWYERAVWGNVVAVIPLAGLALLGWFWHKGAVQEMHRKLDKAAERADVHAEHMKRVLDLLDPETDGGMAVVLDRLDAATPGGIKDVLDAIRAKPIPMPTARSGKAPSE